MSRRVKSYQLLNTAVSRQTNSWNPFSSSDHKNFIHNVHKLDLCFRPKIHKAFLDDVHGVPGSKNTNIHWSLRLGFARAYQGTAPRPAGGYSPCYDITLFLVEHKHLFRFTWDLESCMRVIGDWRSFQFYVYNYSIPIFCENHLGTHETHPKCIPK